MNRISNAFSFLVLITYLVTQGASAMESLNTTDWTYSLPRGSFVPGHTVNLIERGTLAGKFEKIVRATPSSAPVAEAVAFSDELERMSRSAQRENTVIEDLRAQAQTAFQNLRERWETLGRGAGASAARAVPTPSPSPAGAEAAAVLAAPQVAEFLKCVTAQLPRIKELIQMQRWLDGADIEQRVLIQGRIRNLNTQLGQERLKRESGVAPSVVCGRHLGRAFFALPTIEEEVKLLTALVRRQGAEQSMILKTALVAFAPALDRAGVVTPQGVSDLWKMYWRMLSIEAVFSERPLPSYAELQTQLLNRLRQQFRFQGERAIDEALLIESTQYGVAYAHEVLGDI